MARAGESSLQLPGETLALAATSMTPAPAPLNGRKQISGRIEAALALLAIAAVLTVHLSPLARLAEHTSRVPRDYYGYLTEAFHAGQLHLNVPVDPRLEALENPYAGAQGARRPHDMSYYQGRFYLYYGTTPVWLLFLPWRAATGTFLDESIGTTCLLAGGFLLAAVWLIRARYRWFPSAPPYGLPLLLLALGLGPPLFSEIHNVTFYAVPIAGGYFCLMAALTFAERALDGASAERQAAWLAASSLAWGLAVASRPIYVAGLGVLGVIALGLWWRAGAATRWRWRGLRLVAAAIVPAALIGVGMMWYNYLRFDHPLEFGIRFSMSSVDIRDTRLVGLEFIPKNLRYYLLQTVPVIRYAPFFILGGGSPGLLPHLPFAALALLFPLTWRRQEAGAARWRWSSFMLFGAAAANLGLLCLFFGAEERYLLDFVPVWTLLAATVLLALLEAVRTRRVLRWLAGTAVLGLAGYTLFTGCMLNFSRQPEKPSHRKIERLLNGPTAWYEQRTGTPFGPVECVVQLPRGRTGETEPLLVTGYGGAAADGITIRYLDDTHVQFGAFHTGRGGPLSEPIELDYGQPHRLRLELGSLYPPPGHPLFRGWPSVQINRIRRQLKVTLDGRSVLQGSLPVYPSTPPHVQVGGRPAALNVAGPVFTGRIAALRRTGIDRTLVAAYEDRAGPVRLTLRFPPRSGDEGLPLIATGGGERGDLVFAQLRDGNRVAFGHDSFGAGAIVVPPVPYDPARDQVVDIEMGSLYPPEADVSPALRHRFRVALNGTVVVDTSRPFNPSPGEDVEFGFNTIRASTAIDYFPGAIRSLERVAAQPRPAGNHWGPLRLTVLFPETRQPVAEPLLVTGHTGRADVLFVRYEPDGRVRFGLDHWGTGGGLGPPIALDRRQPHVIEIHSGGLLPPPADPAWNGRSQTDVARLRQTIEVRLGGEVVFAPPVAPYANELSETAIGTNLIGASSCDPTFTGQILAAERLPW